MATPSTNTSNVSPSELESVNVEITLKSFNIVKSLLSRIDTMAELIEEYKEQLIDARGYQAKESYHKMIISAQRMQDESIEKATILYMATLRPVKTLSDLATSSPNPSPTIPGPEATTGFAEDDSLELPSIEDLDQMISDLEQTQNNDDNPDTDTDTSPDD